MHWKEQFDLAIELGSFWVEPPYRKDIKDFITAEIIEKLIADIPERTDLRGNRILYGDAVEIKQQLKDKWL